MRWNELSEESCSVARTVSVIGDRWTMLVLRECFLRVRRFEEFQERLGITRHLLADRLRKLVKLGVLERVSYQKNPPRHEYRLTAKGLDLHPIVLAMVHWGDKYMAGKRGRPYVLEHSCGHTFDPVMTCSACGDAVHAKQVRRLDGPGAPRAGSRQARKQRISGRAT
jgi:DNA-binding HxlR family transcriptional regulator